MSPNVAEPVNTEETVEAAILRKQLNAARVRPADVEGNIRCIEICTFRSYLGQVLRWAVITTNSGFAVTGRPSCSVSPENDDEEIGRRVALENAKAEMWPLMGYALRERVRHELTQPDRDLADARRMASAGAPFIDPSGEG